MYDWYLAKVLLVGRTIKLSKYSFWNTILKIQFSKYNSQIQLSKYNSQNTILQIQFSKYNSWITILKIQFLKYNFEIQLSKYNYQNTIIKIQLSKCNSHNKILKMVEQSKIHFSKTFSQIQFLKLSNCRKYNWLDSDNDSGLKQGAGCSRSLTNQ